LELQEEEFNKGRIVRTVLDNIHYFFFLLYRKNVLLEEIFDRFVLDSALTL